jgi:hypothetical protein
MHCKLLQKGLTMEKKSLGIIGFTIIILLIITNNSQLFIHSDPGVSEKLVIQTRDGGNITVESQPLYQYSNSSGCVIRTDTYGNQQWGKTYPELVHASAVLQTGDGGYIIVGSGSGSGIVAEYNCPQFYVIKTDSVGEIIWQKYLLNDVESGLPTWATSVQETRDGGYVMSGNWDAIHSWKAMCVKTDSSGNIQWSTSFDSPSREIGGLPISFNNVIQTSDGGYVCAGSEDQDSSGVELSYALLIKVSSSGVLQWRKTYSPNLSESSPYFSSVSECRDGDLVAIGKVVIGNYPNVFSNSIVTLFDSLGNLKYEPVGPIKN